VKAWPGVQIIARPETREALLGDKIGYVKDIAESVDGRRKTWGQVSADLRKKGDPDDIKVADYLDRYFQHDIDITQREYKTVDITPPDLTFTGDISLYRGKREIRVLYLGKGHTAGDVVVYLPQEKLLASGDLVASPPFAYKYATEIDDTLEALDALDFDTLVPGHGPVLQGKDYLHRLQALLKDTEGQVRPLMQQGLGVDDILKRLDLKAETDSFAGQDPVARYMFDLNFTQNYVQNLYDELKAGD
jgi:glyoxylase-like metal-dependent hydrolase (beta-lactamase superfamily II)